MTRIELLVVLLILAMLLALVIPRLVIARESARHVQSWNRLRSIGLIYEMRSGGSDASLPDPVGLNRGRNDTKFADTELLVAAVLAIFAASGAMASSLFIILAVHYFNRRGHDFISEMHAEHWSRSFLGSWFCPPSSSKT